VERVPEAIERFRTACQTDPHGLSGALARQELEKLGALDA
jgi:hypothetical protein